MSSTATGLGWMIDPPTHTKIGGFRWPQLPPPPPHKLFLKPKISFCPLGDEEMLNLRRKSLAPRSPAKIVLHRHWVVANSLLGLQWTSNALLSKTCQTAQQDEETENQNVLIISKDGPDPIVDASLYCRRKLCGVIVLLS
jgi:hypothetical protein